MRVTLNRYFLRLLWTFALALGLSVVFSAASQPNDIADRKKEVFTFFQWGRQFYDDEDYESAIKSWNKVLEVEPNNEEAKILIEEARYQMQARGLASPSKAPPTPVRAARSPSAAAGPPKLAAAN